MPIVVFFGYSWPINSLNDSLKFILIYIWKLLPVLCIILYIFIVSILSFFETKIMSRPESATRSSFLFLPPVKLLAKVGRVARLSSLYGATSSLND